MDLEIQLDILGEVAIAIILGGIIGLERDLAGKPAGLRTHMLICGVSAFLVGTGNAFILSFKQSGFIDFIRADPFRIMGAVITGLSFIGAGSIIRTRQEDRIEGLTTAASLLFASAIGMSVALGQLYLSVGATILVVTVNSGLIFFEAWIKKKLMKRINKY